MILVMSGIAGVNVRRRREASAENGFCFYRHGLLSF